jgi:predicted GNAT family acetyltransferase
MGKRETARVEILLRQREPWYVAACGRFLRHEQSRDPVWTLRNRTGRIAALIIQSKQNLLPVFSVRKDIPPPRFLRGLFGGVPVHSVQGLEAEAAVLDKLLAELGRQVKERIDFDLMGIDHPPRQGCFSAGPANLIIRRPGFTDIDALAALQSAYEREEVLPQGAVFSPAASRMNTEHLLRDEQLFIAELNGRLVGKINTSACSFTRFQVGGVYVHPDYRGLGIARRMAAEFVHALIAQGKGLTLFVKKANPAARSVYLRLGFQILADYRISYYQDGRTASGGPPEADAH